MMAAKRSRILTVLLPLILIVFCLSPAPSAFAAENELVFFPLAIYVDPSKSFLQGGLRSMFLSRLSGQGIEVVGNKRLDPLLSEEDKKGVTSREKAVKLTKQIGANFALFGSVTSVGGAYSLDLTILDLTEKDPFFTTVSDVVDEDELIFKLADVADQARAIMQGGRYIPTERVRAPSGSVTSEPSMGLVKKDERKIGMTITAFDAADLNGDRVPEWVVVGRDEAQLYSRETGAYTVKDRLKPARGEIFLKVSVGDADGNGRPEIYLAGLYGNSVRTTVWEWSGTFKRLFDIPGNLRVLMDPVQNQATLIFQDSRRDEPFIGDIYRMEYSGEGKLTRAGTLSLPDDAQFYTLTFVDLDKDGRIECLGLDYYLRLHLWDEGGKSLWDSGEEMGGTNNVIDWSKEYLGPREFGTPLNSRIVLMDMDGDGKEEIIAIQNEAQLKVLAAVKLYTKGKVVAYKTEGKSLMKVWESQTLDHYIVDIQTPDRTLFVATTRAKRQHLTKGSGRIIWFE